MTSLYKYYNAFNPIYALWLTENSFFSNNFLSFSMRVVKSDFILDRSRPGKTTTVTSDWAPRVTGGHATWMQRRGGKQWRRRKERNEERKKAKKIKLRVAALNVGTNGKRREVADLMERRRVDILCVKETKRMV